MSGPTSHSYPLRPEAQDQLAVALRERFRVARCATCGGPEIFSKRKPTTSRCLRCGARPELAVEKPVVSWRRCALCHEPTMTGRPLTARFCAACARLSSRERAKRLRWARESANLGPKT
jgi:hypothetical protein